MSRKSREMKLPADPESMKAFTLGMVVKLDTLARDVLLPHSTSTVDEKSFVDALHLTGGRCRLA